MRRTRFLAGCLAAASLVAAIVGAVALSSTGRAPEGAPPTDALLPDLDPIAPRGLEVKIVERDGRPRALLSFVSAAENRGLGPLVIRGDRVDIGTVAMNAKQVLMRRSGDPIEWPDAGDLTYVEDPTHQHWHLRPFMRYQLLRASDGRPVRPDEKTGFCLGDRYQADPVTLLEGEPPAAVYTTNCGLGDRGLLGIEEGISVGYGDDYRAWLDDQWIDITRLPAGRYLLVHRVNVDRRLLESDYDNNASSVLIRISWPAGRAGSPAIVVLRNCPDKPVCNRPR